MEIKAVAIDIDGTITTEDRKIPPKSVEAIQELEAGGISVVLASGNVLPIAYGLAQYLGTSGPIVAENGGVVCYQRNIEVLHEIDRAMMAYKKIEEMEGVERLFTDRWRVSEVGLKRIAKVDEIKQKIEGLPVDLVTTGYAIHIMEKGMNKMQGLKKAAELMDIDVENILAIGDSYNDIEMLEGCGISGVPANAPMDVKKVADIVSEEEYYRGFVDILEAAGLL